MSICLLWLPLLLFLEKKTVALSQKIFKVLDIELTILRHEIKFHNHNAYVVAL